MSQLTRGYISGIADNSRISYCPLCRAVLGTNAYYGDGTVVCDECDFHFAVIECEEKEQDVEEETRWIPCNERLPEDESYILVSFENCTMPDIARYEENDEGGTFYPGDDEKSYSSYGLFVNAWMPLPEPYKEGEDE